MWTIIILSLWITQGLVMFVDEFYYHHKRNLTNWERRGHPIDSFFFLAPFIYTLFFYDPFWFWGLCGVSCLLVTKDEFVHARFCSPGEQWLHSLLFLLHPMAFLALWLAWHHELYHLIHFQIFLIALFLSYQVFYWNFFKRPFHETPNET